MKGLTFNRWDADDRALYAVDPFGLRVLSVDPSTGARTTLLEDSHLFNFPVTSTFLPSSGGAQTLLVASDQEHRSSGINLALTEDVLEPPFLVTKVLLPRGGR